MEMRQKTQGSSGILAITSRQFEGMMRLSEAFAKIRLADKTNEEDAENAINVFKGFLRSFGFNYETGDIDIDKAEGRTSGQKRKESRELSEIYKELTAMFGNKVPMLDFVEACEKEGIRKAEKKIRQRISEGEFTEPEYGFVKRA
jgi:replicative DNA helicase Mcm